MFASNSGNRPQTEQSIPQIRLDDFRSNSLFTGIDGRGYSIVILDTGIDRDHPAFGQDNNRDGISDRIIFSTDLSGSNDGDASDTDGHGSHVSSIAAAVASGANIIHLKVFPDGSEPTANSADVEEALQWVINNAATFNIISVNLSLGSGNLAAPTPHSTSAGSLATLRNQGIAVITAAGNDYVGAIDPTNFGVPGVNNYSADPNTISVGAVDHSDRIADFSQRHATLLDIMAPGVDITGANQSGGFVPKNGTSQAAPHVAGIVAVAQQLAERELGRRLTVQELRDLMQTTGVTVNDGDDEIDGVPNTGLNFQRVDVFGLGEGILTARIGVMPTAQADTLTGTARDDYLAGFGGNDILRGHIGNDFLSGKNGADELDGGTGIDEMVGGSGDDRYHVNTQLDVVTELVSEGTDIVFASDSYALSSHVENLTLIGNFAINGTGNSSENRILGNEIDNTLAGQGGADQLIGGDGSDVLNGGDGSDVMEGGTGDDHYFVDRTDDVVLERDKEGVDTVHTTINYRLGETLEHLQLIGFNAINGTGNSIDNTITGNSAANILQGQAGIDQLIGNAGDDTLDGGTGNDTLTGGTGNDTYFVDTAQDTVIELASEGTDTVNSTFDYTLTANLENLTLLGTAKMGIGNAVDNLILGNSEHNILQGDLGNDTLSGNAGDDRLNGEAGIDTMTGGSGDDEYWVDQAQDIVIEQAKEGKDLVYTTVTYTLSVHVEELTLTGTQAIDGTGNDLDNQITGNVANNNLKGEAGNDTLLGAAGDDQLNGGTGNDQLVGGLGNDKYWIDSEKDNIAENANQGTDIVHASIDYILKANLENLILTGMAARATGNELVNHIQGNGQDNMLKGMAGNDTLIGYLGNDELDGGAGDDNMQGGVGDDRYVVDSIYDAILESVNQGIDSVMSTVSYTLSANVEQLTLMGDQAINGVGNDLDNTVTGNQNSNMLQGEAGDDNLIGNEGDDVLDGGTGKDTLNAGLGNDTLKSSFGDDKMAGGKGDDVYWLSTTTDQITELAREGTDSIYVSVSYALSDHLENLILTETHAINGAGNALNNRMTGNSAVNYLNAGSGNDWVNGDAGSDYLYGETGDDTLLGGLDQDTARGGDGNDRLLGDAGDDWLLGDIGNDTLLGDIGKDRLLGGLGDDILTGGDGNDSLFGEAGDDAMTGSHGRDWLWGGAGDDRFFCNAPQQGIDTIKDFTLGRDKVVLNRSQFTTLNRIRFDSVKNMQQAKRSRSELTYVRSKGVLFYNENGREIGFGVSGGALIKLNAGLDLQAKDLALATLP